MMPWRCGSRFSPDEDTPDRGLVPELQAVLEEEEEAEEAEEVEEAESNPLEEIEEEDEEGIRVDPQEEEADELFEASLQRVPACNCLFETAPTGC